MKEKKLVTFITLFVMLQPIFDILVYVANNIFEYKSLIISFIRPMIAIILFLYLYVQNKRNKIAGIQKYYIIYLIIYAIYSVFHLFNIRNYFFSSSIGSLSGEFRYICNYGYYLLLLMIFDMARKQLTEEELKKVLKYFVYAGLVMTFLYLISVISGTSLNTYLSISTKQGWKGWSVSSHYVGHSLTFMLPIIIYVLFEKKYCLQKIKYLILILILIPGVYLVGTKTPLLAQIIIVVAYTLFSLCASIIKKTNINKDNVFFILVSLVLIFTYPFTFGYDNLKNQNNVLESSSENSIDLIENNLIVNEDEIKNGDEDSDFVFPSMLTKDLETRFKYVLKENKDIRLKYFDNRDIQKKINKDLRNISPLKDKLFGYGHDTLPNCIWVETDAWTIFYSYGLIGFILIIILPFSVIATNALRCLINIKHMIVSKFLLGISFCLGVFIVFEVGYTLQFAQTVFYLVALLILANEVFKESEEKMTKDYLFCINDLNIGGAEVGMVDVINELVHQGKSIDLVLLRKRGPLLDKLDKNVDVYEILDSNYNRMKKKLYYILYMLGGPFIKFVYEKTIKCNYNTEIAYLEGYPAVFIAASNNANSVKVASIRVGLKNHKLKASRLPWGEYEVKKAYQKMDNIYTVSDLTTQEFIEKYPFCSNKTTTIYTYFNVSEIRKKAKEKYDYKFDKNKINFLAVGRFNAQKSYDRLIQAFSEVSKKHKDVLLHILGTYDTKEGKEVIELIKKKKLDKKVILHGVKNNPYPFIKDCDCLVSSSLYEGFPRVVNEAISLGKLCIGTDVTGTKEALHNGKLGMLVEDSVAGLVKGMNDYIKNPDIYNNYKEEILKFDGNKQSYFNSLEKISKKRKSMIIYMPKLTIGGMEKALVNLINYGKLNDNYELTLYLVYNDGLNYLEDLPNNMKVIVASPKKWNLLGKSVSSIKLFGRCIYHLFNKYDIAISYSYQHPVLNSLTRMASDNNIVYIHSNLEKVWESKVLSNKLKKCKYEKFKKIICVSEESSNSLSKLINRTDNVFVINNLIDGDNILSKSLEKVEDFKFRKNEINFIHISRHEEKVKKINRIIDATIRLNKEGYKFNVILIGDGPSHQTYKKRIKENKIKNIFLLGKKKNPYKYLHNSSALVISSEREGYPVVFVESMVLNKPIITTNVSDAMKDIKNKFGIVVDNNETDIYNGMKEFLDNGYTIKKHFNYVKFNKQICDKTKKIYEEV